MKKVILYLEEDRIRDLINFLGVQDIDDTRNIVEKYDLDDVYSNLYILLYIHIHI